MICLPQALLLVNPTETSTEAIRCTIIPLSKGLACRQVTASVVGAIAPAMEKAEIERAKRKPTESLDAYDHYLLGVAATHDANVSQMI